MGDKVKLITEPEAAMVHAFDQLPKSEICTGDAYILCDAGGGTVDLVTYVIKDVDPLTVDEVVAGDGACCGSVYLNRSFQLYLQAKLGHLKFWKDHHMTKALSHFEKTAKPNFDTVESTVVIKIPGLSSFSNDHVRIKKDKLFIPAEDIADMFREPLLITCRMINEQRRKAQQNQVSIKGLIFVGGFAQSPFARKFLVQNLRWLNRDAKFIVPGDGWTAVARGALSRVLPILCPSTVMPMVASRVTRFAYGITYSVEYTPGIDPEKARFLDPLDGRYYIEKVKWFIHKGARVQEGHTRKFGYFHSWEKKTTTARKKTIKLNIYSYDGSNGDSAPPYPSSEGVEKVTELSVDFGRIPVKKLRTYSRNRVAYYWCQPLVHIICSFASIQYELWHEQVCYGNVETDYDG